jgi:hypothetical protein
VNRAIRRTLRTLAQLIAAGGLTGLVAAVADGLTPYVAGIVLAASTLGATFLQNLLEGVGAVAPVLDDPQSAPGRKSNPSMERERGR